MLGLVSEGKNFVFLSIQNEGPGEKVLAVQMWDMKYMLKKRDNDTTV